MLFHSEQSSVNMILLEINRILVLIKSGTLEQSEREEHCYMLHWLFCQATPFERGSAGFSKILLNVALLFCKFKPVQETPLYFKQSDWVALLSPRFDLYYSKKDVMFETDHELNARFILRDIPLQPYTQPRGRAVRLSHGRYFGARHHSRKRTKL